MFRKVFFLVTALMLSTAINAQEWIGFGSRSEGSAPEVNLLRNDNQSVSLTITLSGMYVEEKSEISGVYKRLSMPECNSIVYDLFDKYTLKTCDFYVLCAEQISNKVLRLH
jgi:hypothetical protein